MTTTAQGIREKANTAKARGLLAQRGLVFASSCDKCMHLEQCSKLAPAQQVLCELSDEELGLTLPDPKEEDYERCTEENASYYLQVHVVGAR